MLHKVNVIWQSEIAAEEVRMGMFTLDYSFT